MFKSYRVYGYALLVIVLITPCVRANEVVAEGRSEGASISSREQAFSDALREAVRLGAGVNIASQSSTRKYALEYDRVFAAAFGYVKSYKILESGMQEDGLYHVKIQADVGELDPSLNSSMAMRQLVYLKGSPRVALDLHESIGGIPADSRDAEAWFEERAKDMQLMIVDPAFVRNQELKLARRDEILGVDDPTLHGGDITQKADFIIQGNVKGHYEGLQSFFGSRPHHAFTMSANLRAIRPETGEVIASETIKPCVYYDSNNGAIELAAKDIITKLLDGNESQNQTGAQGLFRKIFATWASELDLGRTVRVEILKIDEISLRSLVEKLKGDPHVSGVWEREFDNRVGSILDIETRLSSPELIAQITKNLGGYYSMEYGTQHYITFVRNGAPTLKKLNGFIGEIVGRVFGNSDAKWDSNETYTVWIEGVEANPKTPLGNLWHDDGTAPNLVVSLTWRNNIILETPEFPNALIAQWDFPGNTKLDIPKADIARIHARSEETIDRGVRDRGLLKAQWVGGGRVSCGRLKPGRNILSMNDPQCGLKTITLRITPSADLQKVQRCPERINRVFVGTVLSPPTPNVSESTFQRSKAGRLMQQGIEIISGLFNSPRTTN